MWDPVDKFFLFIGDTNSEAATSRLQTGNKIYRKKMLRSKPENWQKIIALAKNEHLQGILATFTGSDYEQMVTPTYAKVLTELLDQIATTPHVIFVHEAVLFAENESDGPQAEAPDPDDQAVLDEMVYEWEEYADDGTFNPDPWSTRPLSAEDYFGKIPEDVRAMVNEMLRSRDLNIVPYRTNAERSVLAASFLDDHERHLLFRVYVPAGRLYANEADTLLNLFHDWLNQTGRTAVRQDGYRTPAGQVYEFFGTQDMPSDELTRQFRDFSEFLDACVDEPEAAVNQLKNAGVAPINAEQMVSRYGKATRRLRLDLKHAREERLLTIQHEIESELLDSGELVNANLGSLLQELVPPTTQGAQGILIPTVASGTVTASTVNVTVNQQIVGHVSGHVVQSVQGIAQLSPEAQEILELVGRFGGPKTADLESAVHELEDADARPEDRLAARQKLRSFLGAVAAKASDLALSTLQKYIEHRVGVS